MDRPPLAARLGLLVIATLLIAFFGWASIAEVDEIARGEGKVIPVSKTQIVQSSEAGVVTEIAVRPGEVVKRGDLILRIDDTLNTSSLDESRARAGAYRAQIARLDLEERGAFDAPYVCPAEIEQAYPSICQNEARLFDARVGNVRNKKSVLEERLMQRERELEELRANITRLQQNEVVTKREADLLRPMVERKLVAQTELLRVEKELTETKGQLSLNHESIPRLEAAIKEANLQVNELLLQVQQEALAEKREILANLSVIEATMRGATDRVARTDIRSPVDGIINTLDVTTVGAYVQPGTVIAGVVPTADTLLVEARISPSDVAFIRVGQPAIVKLTAFDFTIYGGLDGEVQTISADSLVDQHSGETYYQALVHTNKSALERNGVSHSIMPGMIASVDVLTGKKTILAYLLKPINKARREALRER